MSSLKSVSRHEEAYAGGGSFSPQDGLNEQKKFVMNLTELVINMTGFVLNMAGFVLNMTGFDLNITGFVLNTR